MPVECQDCGSHFLISNSDVVQGPSCQHCGSSNLARPEPDQPSPTHSDGELRNMVNTDTGEDMGGNPLQEGVWGNIDGGFQPIDKRDESFASVQADFNDPMSQQQEEQCPKCGLGPVVEGRCYNCGAHVSPWDNVDLGGRAEGWKMHAAAPLPPGEVEPQHHFTATAGSVHGGPTKFLAFLDANIEGMDMRNDEHRKQIAALTSPGSPAVENHPVEVRHPDGTVEHKLVNIPERPKGEWFGKPLTVSVHYPEHEDAARELVERGHEISGSPLPGGHMNAAGKAIMSGQMQPPPVSGPWQQQPTMAKVAGEWDFDDETPEQNQAFIIHNNQVYTGHDKHEDIAHYNQLQGFPNGMTFGWLKNGEASFAQHDSRLRPQEIAQHLQNHFGTPVTVDPNLKPGSDADRWFGPNQRRVPDQRNEKAQLNYKDLTRQRDQMEQQRGRPFGYYNDPVFNRGGSRHNTLNMEPYMPWTHEADTIHESLAFLAPLAGMAGRALLSRAAMPLMRKAVQSVGTHALINQVMPGGGAGGQAPMPTEPAIHDVQSLAKVAKDPMETPDSHPTLTETHDPEAVDQQEFNDGDHNPAFNNPNLDTEGLGSGLEDGVKQKLELATDDPLVDEIEQLLPKILEYVHSDQSGLDDPTLRGLHEKLDKQHPGYSESDDDDDDSVEQLLKLLKEPSAVTAAWPAGSLPGAPMNGSPGASVPPNAQQPGVPGAATPGQPSLPGQMPSQGTCPNCGGTLPANGVCPQCGMANVGQGPQAQGMPGAVQPQVPGLPGIAHTGADHQGPVTPQQKEMFAEYLIQQGRQEEVAAMMVNPGAYAEEWKQFINDTSTQPPTVDPNEQAAMGPVEETPPNAGMPMPGMEAPPMGAPTAKVAETYAPQGFDQYDNITRNDQSAPTPEELQQMDPVRAQAWAVALAMRAQNGAMNDARMQGAGYSPRPDQRQGADNVGKRCPKCGSATTAIMNGDGDTRCSRCNNIFTTDAIKDKPDAIVSRWKVSAPDPTAFAEQMPQSTQQDSAIDQGSPDEQGPQEPESSVTWQDTDGQQLVEGQTYEMHSDTYQGPDIIRIDAVKPDSIAYTEVGSQDPNNPGPQYTGEESLQDLQANGLTFVPIGGDPQQDQQPERPDQPQEAQGPGQTVNTEPVETPDIPGIHSMVASPTSSNSSSVRLTNFTRMAPMSEYDQYFGGDSGSAEKAKKAMIDKYGEEEGTKIFYATVNKKKGKDKESAVESNYTEDECPQCKYGHVTSEMLDMNTKQCECYRCAFQWKVADNSEDADIEGLDLSWVYDDDGDPVGFDERTLAMAQSGESRSLSAIADRDPRNQRIREVLDNNKTAGRKYNLREQRAFVDEDGVARNSDRLDLSGTHYEMEAPHLTGARPDRVDDNYLGLGL